MYENPLAPKRRKRKPNDLSDLGLGFRLSSSPTRRKRNRKSSTKKKKTTKKTVIATKRQNIPMIWKDNILRKQKNLCASKICKELHQKRTKMLINNRSDFDHIKPLALGGKHTESNIQGLCPGCHRQKTRNDRYKISKARKEGSLGPVKKTTKKSKKKIETKVRAIVDIMGRTELVPKSQAKQVTNILTDKKEWVLK